MIKGTSEIYIRLPIPLKKWLADYSARHGITMKDVVITSLEDFKEKHDPQELRPRGK